LLEHVLLRAKQGQGRQTDARFCGSAEHCCAAHLDQSLLSRWLLLLQPPKQPQREGVNARHELEHFNLQGGHFCGCQHTNSQAPLTQCVVTENGTRAPAAIKIQRMRAGIDDEWSMQQWKKAEPGKQGTNRCQAGSITRVGAALIFLRMQHATTNRSAA
jgi:hypothetical protein